VGQPGSIGHALRSHGRDHPYRTDGASSGCEAAGPDSRRHLRRGVVARGLSPRRGIRRDALDQGDPGSAHRGRTPGHGPAGRRRPAAQPLGAGTGCWAGRSTVSGRSERQIAQRLRPLPWKDTRRTVENRLRCERSGTASTCSSGGFKPSPITAGSRDCRAAVGERVHARAFAEHQLQLLQPCGDPSVAWTVSLASWG
jgi:hypothetical protein